MKTLYGVGFFDLLDREAQKLIEYDKMSGGTGSWAGRLLETQIKFYNLGMRGEKPTEWKKYEIMFNKENDPEYKTYLKLKNKFEQ